MRNITFHPETLIQFKAKEGSTVTDALNEAILFCQTESTFECELEYNGFLFDITPTSSVEEKRQEYYRWKNQNK